MCPAVMAQVDGTAWLVPAWLGHQCIACSVACCLSLVEQRCANVAAHTRVQPAPRNCVSFTHDPGIAMPHSVSKHQSPKCMELGQFVGSSALHMHADSWAVRQQEDRRGLAG